MVCRGCVSVRLPAPFHPFAIVVTSGPKGVVPGHGPGARGIVLPLQTALVIIIYFANSHTVLFYLYIYIYSWYMLCTQLAKFSRYFKYIILYCFFELLLMLSVYASSNEFDVIYNIRLLIYFK